MYLVNDINLNRYFALQNCRNGHEACIVITCNIPNLRANESSIITIEGFVHDSSFLVWYVCVV